MEIMFFGFYFYLDWMDIQLLLSCYFHRFFPCVVVIRTLCSVVFMLLIWINCEIFTVQHSNSNFFIVNQGFEVNYFIGIVLLLLCIGERNGLSVIFDSLLIWDGTYVVFALSVFLFVGIVGLCCVRIHWIVFPFFRINFQ